MLPRVIQPFWYQAMAIKEADMGLGWRWMLSCMESSASRHCLLESTALRSAACGERNCMDFSWAKHGNEACCSQKASFSALMRGEAEPML